MVPKRNSLRIVGGVWRSRRIQFADNPDIRPTPDRVRETLFNWLADKIEGARCLDLFAGSGALGFEAASRGASHVTQVDRNASVVAMLELQKQALQARQVDIVCQDALDYV
ncbi:MAG: methyltransferase, partial [Proteobacteria bacterium]|nr:methyltransferase [Pseudomonadota bacterium]